MRFLILAMYYDVIINCNNAAWGCALFYMATLQSQKAVSAYLQSTTELTGNNIY